MNACMCTCMHVCTYIPCKADAIFGPTSLEFPKEVQLLKPRGGFGAGTPRWKLWPSSRHPDQPKCQPGPKESKDSQNPFKGAPKQLPKPQKYVEQWLLGLLLMVLGYDFKGSLSAGSERAKTRAPA